MAAPPASDTQSDNSWKTPARTPFIGGLVLLALAAAVVIGVMASGGPSESEKRDRDRRRIEEFQEALLPLAQEWGRIEIQGMRPAISDLETGEDVPPETVAGEARAWRGGFEELRKKIAALDAPRNLERSKELFDEAIVHYIQAATEFERAADGPAAGRRAGVDKGVAEAREGARLYNEASMVLQDARRSVGLEPTDDFPDHPAGRQNVDED